YGLCAEAIRRAAGILAGEPLELRRRKLARHVGRVLPGAAASRVTEFLGELSSVPFSDAASPGLKAARQDAILMGDAQRAAWEDWIAAECGAAAVLLVLEDLHWGD